MLEDESQIVNEVFNLFLLCTLQMGWSSVEAKCIGFGVMPSRILKLIGWKILLNKMKLRRLFLIVKG